MNYSKHTIEYTVYIQMHLNWHNQYANVINSKLVKPQEFIKILKKQVKTTVSIACVDFRDGLKCLTLYHAM